MKRLGLFSMALLAGCVPTHKEYTIIRETSRPAVEETVVTKEAVDPIQTTGIQTTAQVTSQCGSAPCAQPAPTYFAGTYNKPQGVYQTQQPITYQSGGCGGQVMCGQNLAATLGGTVMNMSNTQMMGATVAQPLPAPVQMMTQPTTPQMPSQQMQTTTIQVPVQIPTSGQMLQTETFYETQVMPNIVVSQVPMMPTVAPTMEQPTIIILQHPVNRDLVKCSFGDAACVAGYEGQGYVQLRNTTDFSGYNAVSTSTWQNNNNIPRW